MLGEAAGSDHPGSDVHTKGAELAPPSQEVQKQCRRGGGEGRGTQSGLIQQIKDVSLNSHFWQIIYVPVSIKKFCEIVRTYL